MLESGHHDRINSPAAPQEEDEAPAKLRSDSAGSGATGGADLTPRASRPVNAAQQPASNDGMPAIRGQPTTADGWRVRGNDLFRAGQLEDAAVCYTRSIDVEPTALAYGNRAMARLRMRQWREAAEDAAAAVALDPLYVKGHQRSAVAKAELGDLLGAAQASMPAFLGNVPSNPVPTPRDVAQQSGRALPIVSVPLDDCCGPTFRVAEHSNAHAEVRRAGRDAGDAKSGDDPPQA